ncbi:hypothetical protein CSC17_5211 [Klebsiella oxytoca]|nr:hypothetical protein CSC17_5211 [Klebsiella oxytoca]
MVSAVNNSSSGMHAKLAAYRHNPVSLSWRCESTDDSESADLRD